MLFYISVLIWGLTNLETMMLMFFSLKIQVKASSQETCGDNTHINNADNIK